MDYHLLYNVNRVNGPNLKIPYWQYQHFDLDRMANNECNVEFRFKKNDIYDLVDNMLIPESLTFWPCAWTINGGSVLSQPYPSESLPRKPNKLT